MTDLVSDFLAFIQSEKGVSENTRLAYESDLAQFVLYCRAKGRPLTRIGLGDLRIYLASLRRRSLSQRSIARKLSAIKQFYFFLLRENQIVSNPSELLSVQLKMRRLPKLLSVEEISRVIESASGKTESEIRDRAILELWYATGSRISELVKLTIDRLDLKEGVAKFLGKGGKERFVPVHPTCLEWCKKYREVRHQWLRRFDLKEPHIFFLSRRGSGYTRMGMWKLLKRYVKRAELGRRVFPHMIRHSFATHILLGGADLRVVQELLGHKSIATTEIYTHLQPENLKNMQLKYHPRG